MTETNFEPKKVVLPADRLNQLIGEFRTAGFTVIGPQVRNRVVALEEIDGDFDLSPGCFDEQDAATYRLRQGDGKALFDFVVGPHSAKRYLYPSREKLFEAERTSHGTELKVPELPEQKLALFGLRPCDLASVRVLDAVLAEGDYEDKNYLKRRANSLIVIVNCVRPSGTCFCASMNTGPRAESGFDLALTEVCDVDSHCFLLEVGSETGREVIEELNLADADQDLIAAAERALSEAAGSMGRDLDTTDIVDLLQRNGEIPYWDEVGDRCLNCANCTMVCPTCFCSTVEDTTDLSGDVARRERRLDSCFGINYSYIHGGSVRTSAAARYRHWITHKLSTWHDQFGMSGCIGCGRCITWCPVGIDITEEAAAVRNRDVGAKKVSV